MGLPVSTIAGGEDGVFPPLTHERSQAPGYQTPLTARFLDKQSTSKLPFSLSEILDSPFY